MTRCRPLLGVARCVSRSLMLVALVQLGGCSNEVSDGLTKYPAHGSVLLDGSPMAGLVIRFTSTSPTGDSNSRFPVGVTGPDGAFQLSTNGDGDGAVPGDYDVTVVWPATNTPPLQDKLGGAYSTPAKSKLHVKLEAKENQIPAFELTLPANVRIAKPRNEDE